MESFIKKYIYDFISSPGFKKYLKNTGWLLAARILSMVISLFTTIFIARKIGPTNFGQLSYALSFIAVFSFLPALGLDSVLYKELIKKRDQANIYLGTAFIIKLIAGILTIIAVIGSTFFIVADDVSRILIIILAFSFIFTPFNILSTEFQARVQSKYPSIISIIIILILNILKVAVIFFSQGVIYLSIVLLLESILNMIFYLYIYKRVLNQSVVVWKFDRYIAVQLLKESWPFIFFGAFSVIYARIDQVFIKHMLDAHAVGIYDSAVRVAETWYFIPSVIIVGLLPAIVNANTTSDVLYRSRLKNLFIFILVFTTATSFVITLFAHTIIDILYGSQFYEGIKILQIYVWSSVPISIGSLITSYLVIEKDRMILFVSSFIPMVINVILNLIWIPEYGIVGSAYATLVAYSFVPLIFFIFKRKLIYNVLKFT